MVTLTRDRGRITNLTIYRGIITIRWGPNASLGDKLDRPHRPPTISERSSRVESGENGRVAADEDSLGERTVISGEDGKDDPLDERYVISGEDGKVCPRESLVELLLDDFSGSADVVCTPYKANYCGVSHCSRRNG
ncbi:unnamed protein product [Clavelina lepadiformis]|uniref:Uncharacterized protein n=1 Tax=Clavelina lepadiformis TaxID=159417 RepID=A0ABP0FZL1_CLALP